MRAKRGEVKLIILGTRYILCSLPSLGFLPKSISVRNDPSVASTNSHRYDIAHHTVFSYGFTFLL